MPRSPNDSIPRTRSHEIRIARGLKQAEAARKAGFDVTRLTKIERAKNPNRPSDELAEALAQVYGVPVKELFAPMHSPIPPPIVEVKRDSQTVYEPAEVQFLLVWRELGKASPGLREILLTLAERIVLDFKRTPEADEPDNFTHF